MHTRILNTNNYILYICRPSFENAICVSKIKTNGVINFDYAANTKPTVRCYIQYTTYYYNTILYGLIVIISRAKKYVCILWRMINKLGPILSWSARGILHKIYNNFTIGTYFSRAVRVRAIVTAGCVYTIPVVAYSSRI